MKFWNWSPTAIWHKKQSVKNVFQNHSALLFGIGILVRNTDPDQQKCWKGIQFWSGSTTMKARGGLPGVKK